MPFVDIVLPLKGIFRGVSSNAGVSGYSEYMNNVRAIDVMEKKVRIGQRPGLDKWSATQIGAVEQPVVFLCVVSSVV
ncbi:MAG: hypothetical protein MUP81_04150 [Dehalococcoidia bacterium]|nr:hypothetical protein [Dehalococcoidia bacterium]